MSLLTSLISYWEMEEASGNRVDAHGSNTLTPDANFPGNQTGVVGNATANTNGGFPNKLTVASNASLQMGDIDMTVAGWFKINFFGGRPFMIGKANNNDLEYNIVGDNISGKWAFEVRDTGNTTTTKILSTEVLDANYHFTVGWHDSVNDTLNIQTDNGTVFTTSSYTGGVRSSTNGLGILGSVDDFLASYASADQVGIWKRVLTTQERTDLYNGGSGLSYAALSPAGIAFDAASNSGEKLASSSYNWNHTCTGSDRYLTVSIGMFSLAQSVSAITYNSAAMTFLGSKNSISGACRVEMWGLVAPSTGSNSIAVTLTGAINSGGVASSYTGVHQTLSTEAFNSAQGTNVGAADATVNITSVADNDWIVDVVATDDTTMTVGAGQTQRNNISGTVGAVGDSDEGPKTPAGSVTMSWTGIGALATWSIGGIALRPTAASGPVTSVSNKLFMLMGTGV